MQRLYECLPQDALHACDSRMCLIVNELRASVPERVVRRIV
jgi:hypothetical protein